MTHENNYIEQREVRCNINTADKAVWHYILIMIRERQKTWWITGTLLICTFVYRLASWATQSIRMGSITDKHFYDEKNYLHAGIREEAGRGTSAPTIIRDYKTVCMYYLFTLITWGKEGRESSRNSSNLTLDRRGVGNYHTFIIPLETGEKLQGKQF